VLGAPPTAKGVGNSGLSPGARVNSALPSYCSTTTRDGSTGASRAGSGGSPVLDEAARGAGAGAVGTIDRPGRSVAKPLPGSVGAEPVRETASAGALAGAGLRLLTQLSRTV